MMEFSNCIVLSFLLAVTMRHLSITSAITWRSSRLPHENLRSSFSAGKSLFEEQQPRISVLAEISNTPGSLYDVLSCFRKLRINLTHIESRPNPTNPCEFKLYIDFEDVYEEHYIKRLLEALRARCHNILVLDEKEVPWFPRHITELDLIVHCTLNAGDELLTSDHPGFSEPTYRKRRAALADVALSHTYGKSIPPIEYTPSEVATWRTVYKALEGLHQKHACDEYLTSLEMMKSHCGFGPERIPQAGEVSEFLRKRTGFTLRPVAGLLSPRMFLYGLAFRTFFSTQYIRHSSRPFYTPEPDICHELIGHAPMFADPDFADLSQEIGLASLGASDEDIEKLASCYWFSAEFGLLKEGAGGLPKAYGAGLLSSYGELQYACSRSSLSGSLTKPLSRFKSIRSKLASSRRVSKEGEDSDISVAESSLRSSRDKGNVSKPVYLSWDPEVASHTKYPITTYQPRYFVAESLYDAKEKMRSFYESLRRPFYARYDSLSQSIWVDRAVKPVPPYK